MMAKKYVLPTEEEKKEIMERLIASLPRDLKISKIMLKYECDYYKALDILKVEETLNIMEE